MKTAFALHNRPLLEELEARNLLAFNVGFGHGELELRGTNGPDAVIIHDLGNGSFGIEQNGATTIYSGVNEFEIRARGGDDSVEYVTDTPIGILNSGFGSYRFDIDLGSGNDLFFMTIDYPNAQTLNSSSHHDGTNIQINVEGERGNDSLLFILHNSVPAGVNLKLEMEGGAGSDHVQAFIEPDPNFDGTLKAKLEGGSGNDFVTGAVGTIGADIVNNGSMKFDLEGGSGNDDVAFRAVTAGTLSLTNNGTLIAEVDGNSGVDLVNGLVGANGEPVTNNGVMKIEVQGGSGNDTVAALMGLNFNDGSPFTFTNFGTATLTGDGQGGRDTLNMTAAINGGSPNARFQGTARGGTNHDTLTFLFDREGEGNASAKVRAGRLDDLITVTAIVEVLHARKGRVVVV